MKKQDYPTLVMDAIIERVDRKGRGVINYVHPPKEGSNGKKLTVFVRNTVPGDKVRITVENAKGRRKADVDFDELLEPGPSRNLDVPINRAISGGVPLQSMKYEDQLAYKSEAVKQHLAKQEFDPSVVRPIIGMDEPVRYRNKMELTFGPNGELGMHQQGNYRKIIDLEDSILAPKVMVDVKHEVSKWQKDHQLPGYEKDSHAGLLRHLMMRKSFETDELMVVIFATEGPDTVQKAVEDLVDRLANKFENLKSLLWIEFAGIVDRIQTDASHLLYGRDYINDTLGGFHYRIFQDTFFQANPPQAQKMVDIALEMADVQSDMKTLDLFCGVGTFSLPFAEKSKALAGIEIVESSINSAKRNAVDNNISNTYFLASDARRGLVEIQEKWGQPDLLLLDPPRSGAGGKVMRGIGRLSTDKIVYVSCNPESFAEDIVWLKDYGYELKIVQPVDQFPHTTHVEIVALLEKNKLKNS